MKEPLPNERCNPFTMMFSRLTFLFCFTLPLQVSKFTSGDGCRFRLSECARRDWSSEIPASPSLPQRYARERA